MTHRTWIAALALLVGGCAPAPATPADPGVPAYHPTAPARPAWTPRTSVPQTIMSEDEKRAHRLRSLEDLRASYGLPVMEFPELSRWIYPAEAGSALVPRLADRGFTVTSTPAGTGVTGSAPSAQNQPFTLALLECKAMYTVDPRTTSRQHALEKKRIYDEYWSEFAIPCLRNMGRPMSDLPTFEVFAAGEFIELDEYPYGSAMYEAACPSSVETRYLLGDA